jgi:CheY-like chemotaxis protein/tetratricopeptide (TPR) repeat protein
VATVLIVDDDKHTRSLLERIFHHDERISRYDVRLLQAGDGVEALKIFDAERPDVVITDLLMPRMDGFKLCKELRARPGSAKVGLLVLSGVYKDVSVSSRLREEFGAHFYAKPYQIKDLVGALEKQLFRLSAGSAEASRVETPPDTPPPRPPVPRQGRFQDTPLPRLLLDLHEERATGMLDLRRGRIEKRIDLVVGHPVAVTSNQRGEMLGHFLVLRGVISEKVHQQALELARDEEKRLGEALMSLGVLTTADLVRHLTAQARYKITRALRWPDGEWSFRPNRDLVESAAKGNALDPVAVVLLGLKKTASIEEGAAAAGELSGRKVKLTARGERVRPSIARVFGETFLQALEGTPSVDALAVAPFEPSVSLPALESLILAGCVADAGAAAEVATDAAKAAAEPPPLEELSGAFKLPQVYDTVFGEEMSDAGPPAAPVDDAEIIELTLPSDGVPEEIPLTDSSVIEVTPLGAGSGPILTITAEAPPEAETLRERLLGEYLRIQGKDAYAVLELPRDAGPAAVETSFAAHMAELALETYEPYDIGPDHAKLEEVHAVYRRALEILTSPERRAAYDRELGVRPRASSVDGERMGAELAFRAGERRMTSGNFAGAVEHLQLALDSAPDVADYHAALGWALFRAGGDKARDAAVHLAQALAMDPDHGAAHEHLGQVLLAEGSPERAAEHLEKALDCQPPRLEALAPLEELRLALGEPRQLERRYRALLRRARPGETQLALRLWRGLARVYLVLGERDAARTAFQCAHRLAPEEPTFLDALADLAPAHRERAELLAARWRLEPDALKPAQALFAAELAAGRPDGAFLVASAMAARGLSVPEAEAVHRRHRARFLVRAMRPLDEELVARVRHPDDDPEIGGVFALLEPAAQSFAPLEPADLELTAAHLVAEPPADFARVLEYVAHVLGVARPRVARREDFGAEAHLGALREPVLLAGPDLLASKDRLELAFRLARALSFLPPGRAFVGSRPARKAKQLFVAAVALGGAPVAIGDDDREAGRAIAALPADVRERAARQAAAIATSRATLNFSSYARALARSADRMGLVVCGDVIVATSVVRAQGGEAAAADLLDFAVSNAHQDVRVSVGLSVDV